LILQVSWTEALKAIVKNCYKHHGREDMLNIFGEEVSSGSYLGTMVQTINNPDGTVSIIQIDTGPNNVVTLSDGSQATVIHSVASVSYLKFIKVLYCLLVLFQHC